MRRTKDGRQVGGGGKQPGSGRKPGSKTRSLEERILTRPHVRRRGSGDPILTKKIADKIIADAVLRGESPLEVMLFTMRWHFVEQRYDDAARVAKDAAPYMHPHLTSTKVEFRRPEEMTDDELAAALAAAERIAEGDGEPAGGTPPKGTGKTVH
jgi:hypothetical protein